MMSKSKLAQSELSIASTVPNLTYKLKQRLASTTNIGGEFYPSVVNHQPGVYSQVSIHVGVSI